MDLSQQKKSIVSNNWSISLNVFFRRNRTLRKIRLFNKESKNKSETCRFTTMTPSYAFLFGFDLVNLTKTKKKKKYVK